MINPIQRFSFWLARFRRYRFAVYEFAFATELVANSWSGIKAVISQEWEDYRDTVAELRRRDQNAFDPKKVAP